MVLILTMVISLASGYVLTVLSYFLLSFALTSTAPHFVSSSGHFRSGYLLANCTVWIACTALGGYATAAVSASLFPWLTVSLLGITFAILTWLHPIEAHRQLVGLSRLLMSVLSLFGVALGFFLFKQ